MPGKQDCGGGFTVVYIALNASNCIHKVSFICIPNRSQ